jgi:ATP-binding cassette subfamily F protein 3
MSTLLQINHLNKSFGPRVILDDVTLSIGEKQKIGVIGRNGAGKSTLFRIVVGDDEKDSGEVLIHEGTKIGYLTQHDPYEGDETVMNFLLRMSEKEEWQCAAMAGKFQIKNEMFTRPIQSLPGGYQMRVKLASMLLQDPNLLLLDEPTNYLDLSTLLLLEQFLQSYRGSFLVISHDREFLKNTCTSTLEIDQGKTFFYPGDIEAYLAHKEAQADLAKRYNKKIEREKAHLQTFVDRFRYKASKAAQAQSKMKQIAQLKTIDIISALSTTRIRIPKVEQRKGIALSSHEMTIGYNEKIISSGITLDIERGEHVAIVGDNGSGKTTLMKTFAGVLPTLAGTFRWGPHIKIGYYAQHVPQMLRNQDTVQSYLNAVSAPEIKTEQVLEMAGNFLFRGDDLNKSITLLSGGEKARLCLAGLLLQKNEVLLLDEPTNHLDFETVEALGEALRNTDCTILFISHNRTFVNLVASSIIEVGGGRVRRYHHNYEEYVYHLEQNLEVSRIQKEEERKEVKSSAEERKALQQEIKKERKALQEVEMEIMDLEKEKQKLLSWFEQNSKEYSREKTEKLHDTTYFILEKEKEWMHIQENIEQLSKKL